MTGYDKYPEPITVPGLQVPKGTLLVRPASGHAPEWMKEGEGARPRTEAGDELPSGNAVHIQGTSRHPSPTLCGGGSYRWHGRELCVQD